MTSRKSFEARPTVYKGILMRSRLEAGFAGWLDRNSLIWEYEPCAFANEKGQYLPDFKVTNLKLIGAGIVENVYIEVKPDSFMRAGSASESLDREVISRQADIIHSSDDRAVVLLVQPSAKWYVEPGHGSVARFFAVDFIRERGEAKAVAAAFLDSPWVGEYWRPKAAETVVEPTLPEGMGLMDLALPKAAEIIRNWRDGDDRAVDALLMAPRSRSEWIDLLMAAVGIADVMTQIASGQDDSGWEGPYEYVDEIAARSVQPLADPPTTRTA